MISVSGCTIIELKDGAEFLLKMRINGAVFTAVFPGEESAEKFLKDAKLSFRLLKERESKT